MSSNLQVNTIADAAGTGAPSFTNGLSLKDTVTPAFSIKWVSTSSTTLSANRILSIDVSDGDRFLALKKSLTVVGFDVTLQGNTGGSVVQLPTTGTLATLAGTETLTLKTLTSPTINGGTHTSVTGFSLRDTSAAFDVTMAATSSVNLTAGRTITIDVADGARTLALKKSLTVQTGDMTLIGNASGSSITFPTTGTVATLAGTETLTNKTIDGASNILTIPAQGNIFNLGLTTSVSANAMTVALKQADGSTNASATNPVLISFRNAASATGGLTTVSVTGALSVVIPSGATLGQFSGANEFVWVYALNNAGTVELAVSGRIIADESAVITTTTIGAGSTSGTVLYSTTGRSSVPIRLIGRLKVNETTAGTWASNATEVSLTTYAMVRTQSVGCSYRKTSVVKVVTFTNGSATIAGTAHGFKSNDTILLTTTGTLPTNFATATIYYVSATNLVANSFELSATVGGASISAGSAGTGTHTATSQGQAQAFGGPSPVRWNTKDYDTHGMFDSSLANSVSFTAPILGIYQVNCNVLWSNFSFAATDAPSLILYVNSITRYEVIGNYVNITQSTFHTLINRAIVLNAGDIVDVRFYLEVGTGERRLDSVFGTIQNTIDITRIGDGSTIW